MAHQRVLQVFAAAEPVVLRISVQRPLKRSTMPLFLGALDLVGRC
jgi:hypothetical protein